MVRVAVTALLVFLIGALGAILGPRILHELPDAPTSPWTARARVALAGEGTALASDATLTAEAAGRDALVLVRTDGAWAPPPDRPAPGGWRRGVDWTEADGSLLWRKPTTLALALGGGGADVLLEIDAARVRLAWRVPVPGVGVGVTLGAEGTVAGRRGSAAALLPLFGTDPERVRAAALDQLRGRGWKARLDGDALVLEGAPGLQAVERFWVAFQPAATSPAPTIDLRLEALGD
jgi:hypothetical protein